MKTVVKKFGGATLATPEQIKQVASILSECHRRGENIVAVVSAMGQTTNELINLAHQVSTKPKRRELDMLLTTGERISMSLLSMALNDLNCPAISFTGSQAGILTDDSHLNAFITELNPTRVREALDKKQIVIIAGFQGVSPKTKEITTLGRGGTDTTAVAIAAALSADSCEILKEVPGVFTADPNLCVNAKPIHQLSYQQMLEMTFWGAKVLHYRSVELAIHRNVPIYIGPARHNEQGTWVRPQEENMTIIQTTNLASSTIFESIQILSLNSHSEVLELSWDTLSLTEGLQKLKSELLKKEISFPQLLCSENIAKSKSETNSSLPSSTITTLYITGPSETLNAIKKENSSFYKIDHTWCTVTATCSGASTPEIAAMVFDQLEKHQIKPIRMWMSGMSCTVLLEQQHRTQAITLLHSLVNTKVTRA